MTRERANWGFPRWGEYGTETDPVHVRTCDHTGCDRPADHPAPKAPFSSERWWFCREHAAEYNRNWDFFDGMSDAEAETLREEETRTGGGYAQSGTWSWGGATEADGVNRTEREALAVLELDTDATGPQIKAQYRKLAKRHHPDTNGGDKDAEEAFQRIQAAYQALRHKVA